jgi:hypothetical protein
MDLHGRFVGGLELGGFETTELRLARELRFWHAGNSTPVV